MISSLEKNGPRDERHESDKNGLCIVSEELRRSGGSGRSNSDLYG